MKDNKENENEENLKQNNVLCHGRKEISFN